jgi:hypothetical protein
MMISDANKNLHGSNLSYLQSIHMMSGNIGFHKIRNNSVFAISGGGG